MGAGGTLVDIRNGACDAIAGVALIADAFETAIRVNALGIIMTVIGALVTLVNIGNDRCLIIIVVSVVITTLVVSASLIILVLIFVSVLLPICNLLIVWSILLLVWLVWLEVVVIILELLFLRLLWLELRAWSLIVGSLGRRSLLLGLLLVRPLLTLRRPWRLDRWPLVLRATLIVLLWTVIIVELLLLRLALLRASLLRWSLLIWPLLLLLRWPLLLLLLG